MSGSIPIIETDPLGVLTTTAPVVAQATHVRIVHDRIPAVAAQIAAELTEPPGWDDSLHFRDGTWRTAGWVFVLDALNFCFWSTDADPEHRWRVADHGQIYDGYWALVAALARAVEDGRPLWDPAYLAAISADEVAEILRPATPDTPAIPLFDERVANLRELGRGLLRVEGGADAAALIRLANGSAVTLVQEIVLRFPSFDDIAPYRGYAVRFYKRAQILVADLAASFASEGLGAFHDLDQLTAFADYKVPQVLRGLGVIAYADDLAATIDNRVLLVPGSVEEVEIRAATVWGCEHIRRALVRLGRPLRAFEVDWALWVAGQSLPPDARPYHRTLTGFY
ncbi:MAG: queuosine 5'-phosphate N-glycosylase/hydrolase [Thermomicrobiales bacterium]